MEGKFPPKGKVYDRVAGKSDYFFQKGIEALSFYKITPFSYAITAITAIYGAGAGARARFRPGAESANLRTAAIDLNRVKSGKGSENFRLFRDNPLNGRGARHLGSALCVKRRSETPQQEQVALAVGAEPQTVAAQVYRGYFSLNIKRVDVFL